MKSPVTASKKEALVREILERVADKWTLLVIDALDGENELRFSRLRERIRRQPEDADQDPAAARTGRFSDSRIYAEVPPRVDYKLTPLGESLGESVCSVWTWVERHIQHVKRSRRAYDMSTRRRSSPSHTGGEKQP